MQFVLCALSLVYTKLLIGRSTSVGDPETKILLVRRVLQFLFFLLHCLWTPLVMLQRLKRRNKLPKMKSQLLLLSASEIARKIRKRELSSEEVVKAYIERCNDVNPVLNAIVERRFDAAIHEARDVDKLLTFVGKTDDELAREFPLLGVPITVKWSIAVEGMSYAVGVKKRASVKANRSAEIVDAIRKAGAIVLLISNTPELCLFWETTNKLIGTTWNPYDSTRVPGGSSGGEAALLGSAASCVSLASDIGGSARLPAMFCGVFGHKPTACLVPSKGHRPEKDTPDWFQYFTLGTMVRYAEDLPLVMKVISKPGEYRRRLDQEVSPRNIKFYYMDDCCKIINPIDNDLKQAIEKLRTHIETTYGSKVQKAELREMEYAFDMVGHLLLNLEVPIFAEDVKYMGTSKTILELFKCLFHVSSNSLSVVMFSLLKWVYNVFPKTIQGALMEKKELLKKEFEELLGNDGVLIFPSFSSAAHYPYGAYLKTPDYTLLTIYNVLGLPVTQCPMGLNKKGLPVGIQIVANAGNDYLTIAVAREIEKAFGGWQRPPANELHI